MTLRVSPKLLSVEALGAPTLDGLIRSTHRHFESTTR